MQSIRKYSYVHVLGVTDKPRWCLIISMPCTTKLHGSVATEKNYGSVNFFRSLLKFCPLISNKLQALSWTRKVPFSLCSIIFQFKASEFLSISWTETTKSAIFLSRKERILKNFAFSSVLLEPLKPPQQYWFFTSDYWLLQSVRKDKIKCLLYL